MGECEPRSRHEGKPGWSHVDERIASLDDREYESLIVEIKNHV